MRRIYAFRQHCPPVLRNAVDTCDFVAGSDHLLQQTTHRTLGVGSPGRVLQAKLVPTTHSALGVDLADDDRIVDVRLGANLADDDAELEALGTPEIESEHESFL